jgi:tetratricopeptide (TPR) repeat protein
MLVGGVVLVFFLNAKGYFGSNASTAFVIAHAPWLVTIFTGAAILFAILEYLQHRSPANDDAIGEEIIKPESSGRAARRRSGDDLPKFPPPAPFARQKRIPDQDILTRIIERYAAMPPATEGPRVTIRMLRSEAERAQDWLDAALSRADALGQAGDAEARAAAEAARLSLDVEPLQNYLIAETDRRGYKTREDATAYLAICREIAGLAEVRGDTGVARTHLDEIIRLVPEDLDALCRLGRACLLQNKLVQAEDAYKRILVLTADDEWRAVAFTNLGTVHHLQADMEEAERVYDRALEIDERIGDVKGMAANYAYLGSLCRERGNLGKAEKMFAMALEIDENLEPATKR